MFYLIFIESVARYLCCEKHYNYIIYIMASRCDTLFLDPLISILYKLYYSPIPFFLPELHLVK